MSGTIIDSKEIQIPFSQEMELASIEGRKECTSRNGKYGKPGDVFKLKEQKFLIRHITKLPLWVVAKYLYKAEGFENPQGFIDIWNRLHPTKGYEPEHIVNTHFYTRIDADGRPLQ